MYDLISSSSHNFDVYSMASLGDYGEPSAAEKGKNANNFCYTPSGKSQLKLKMLQNSFADADDSMEMADAP